MMKPVKRLLALLTFGLLGTAAPAQITTHEAAIAYIDAWLQKHRPQYYSELKPGVSGSDLDAYETAFGFTLPTAFRDLYLWKNGHNDQRTAALLFNYMFVPLDHSQDIKADLDAMIGYDFEDPDWWRREWAPFTSSYGGDSLVAVTNGTNQGDLVLNFWHDDALRPIEGTHMADWLIKLARSMQNGSYEADEKTYPAEQK